MAPTNADKLDAWFITPLCPLLLALKVVFNAESGKWCISKNANAVPTDPGLQPGLDTGDTQLCFSDPVEAAHARDRKLEIAKSKDRTGPAASKYSIFDGSSSSYADNPAAPGSLAPFRTLQWSLREEIPIVCPAKTLTIAYDSEYKAFVFPKEVGALK